MYVAGLNVVTVHGLRHGDDDDDDNKEEGKRIGRRTRKRDEGRTKMRITRKRRMRMMMGRIRGKIASTRSVRRASAYLRNSDKGHQQHCDHEIHPEQPAQESEV